MVIKLVNVLVLYGFLRVVQCLHGNAVVCIYEKQYTNKKKYSIVGVLLFGMRHDSVLSVLLPYVGSFERFVNPITSLEYLEIITDNNMR